MSFFLSPIGNTQISDANGDPLSGGLIYTYLAGTTTPAATFTGNTGVTPQANPIELNSLGVPASPIWLTGGTAYKFVIKSAALVTLQTIDDISGINDITATGSEWVDSGFTPIYISATSFSVVGDKTGTLTVGRRVKTANTAGIAYGRISASVYTTLTTVTVVNDSTTLDSGLSSVAYGLIDSVNPSLPNSVVVRTALGAAASGANTDITSITGLTTALSRAQGGTGTALATRQIAQIQTFVTGAVATGTTIIPADDTIPQITEGDQYLSLAITPTNALSMLEIDVIANAEINAISTLTMALFRDAVADAVAVGHPTISVAGQSQQASIKHLVAAGSVAATTFKVRIGPSGTGTVTFNGVGAIRRFGGVMSSRITIKEYLP